MVRIVCRAVRLRYDARLFVDAAEDGSVLLEGLLACVLEHLAHVLWTGSAVAPARGRLGVSPQP